jgi:hypothetical protein
MEQSITYILGAGASFQSIPIVNSFSKRFDEFTNWLDIYSDTPSITYEDRMKFKTAMDRSKKIGKEFNSHHSFDTYFKKLFHTGQFDKINDSKKVLNLYFIWEHLSKTDPAVKKEANCFVKQSEVDKRYDALIGGLLKPIRNTKKLFCKVNFISWNYDLNLLASIKNYFYPNENYKEFFTKIDKQGFEWKINGDISILNMNGYFYSSLFDNIIKIDEASKIEILHKKLTSDYFDQEYKDAEAELVRFAWENSNEDFSSLVETSKQYILNSNNIIVIGYTFPLYNRLLDLSYLNSNTFSYKTVVIQDPNSNEMVQDFRINFEINPAVTNVIAKSQCQSFYVPQGIYIN